MIRSLALTAFVAIAAPAVAALVFVSRLVTGSAARRRTQAPNTQQKVHESGATCVQSTTADGVEVNTWGTEVRA